MARAFIILGSNIEPARYLRLAVRLLAEQLEIEAISRVYQAAPVGAPGTPDFLNVAILVSTARSPLELKMEVLRPIEARLGRRRKEDRNAPRTIDLDLAIYADLVVDEPEADLVIPDPEILQYAHLALPIAELAPRFVHPVVGLTLSEIARPFTRAPEIRRRDDLDLIGTD